MKGTPNRLCMRLTETPNNQEKLWKKYVVGFLKCLAKQLYQIQIKSLNFYPVTSPELFYKYFSWNVPKCFLLNISEWPHLIWNFYHLRKSIIHFIVSNVFESKARIKAHGVGEEKFKMWHERKDSKSSILGLAFFVL